MALEATDLARLSNLLDEALVLDPAACERWLAALDCDDASLVEPCATCSRGGAARAPASCWRGMPFAPAVHERTEPGAGDTVRPSRLLRVLGRGGMGEAWLASASTASCGAPSR